MKLKTMKNIEIKKCDDSELAYELAFIELYKKELKKEAIKWIKTIYEDKKPIRTTKIETLESTKDIMTVLITKENELLFDWIKHFFNLTEADLK